MRASTIIRSRVQTALLLSVLAVASACDKDPTEPEEEPEVTQVRLTIGSQTQTFGSNGGTMTLTARGALAVSAVWLKADGSQDALANTTTFRLVVTPPATGVGSNITYAGTTHSGTLTIPTAVTNAPVQFGLLHIQEGHTDYGPLTVTITAP